MTSIFTFNGLDIKAILGFLKDLPGASVYAMRK